MPRYFFELENDAAIYEDKHGEVYPSDKAALRGAEILAAELLEEGNEFVGSILVVRNENRIQIGVFTLRPPDEHLQ